MHDYLSSAYCTECGGIGYRIEKTWTCPSTGAKHEDLEQCEACEDLHRMEVRADRMMDELKGN
jgi:methionyl-tRNA synthetase